MIGHIERQLVDGVMPHMMLDQGEIVDLIPSKAHPMIVSIGNNYVLCTDFRTIDGTSVNMDFYIADTSGGLVVFQTEVNNHAPLEALVKTGKAAMID